jgi:hypothetical protein
MLLRVVTIAGSQGKIVPPAAAGIAVDVFIDCFHGLMFFLWYRRGCVHCED